MSHSHTPPTVSNAATLDHDSYFSGPGIMPTSAPYNQTQFQNNFGFPSESTPGFETFDYNNIGFASPNADMLPPRARGEPLAKRHKHSHSVDSPTTTMSDGYSPNTGPPTLYSPYLAMPLTPNSSVSSDDPLVRTTLRQSNSLYTPPDLRRMSVQSLINDLPASTPRQYASPSGHRRQYPIADETFTTHGFDRGLPDLDTPNNYDVGAIAVFSPPSDTSNFDNETTYGSAEPSGKEMAFESGGYYAKPVAIRISKSLGTLPRLLMENPMNLLYFHHFLNHTARILVPHDCERNPFRQILPESMCTSMTH